MLNGNAHCVILHCKKNGQYFTQHFAQRWADSQPYQLLGNVLPNVVGKVICPPVKQSNYPTFGQDSVHDYPEHG